MEFEFSISCFENTTYYLDTASSCYLRNSPAFLWFLPSRFFVRVVSCTKRSLYQKRPHPYDFRLALNIISSAPPSSAQQRSAVQWRSLACPGVPCRAVRYCCAMLFGVVIRSVIPPVLLLYVPGTICSITKSCSHSSAQPSYSPAAYYLDTASSRWLRNGPAFLWFLRSRFFYLVARSVHCTRRGAILVISGWF